VGGASAAQASPRADTMTSRDLVLRTLHHQRVDRVPRELWLWPAVEAARPDDVVEIQVRFPPDIVRPDFEYPAGKRSRGKPGREGDHTDAWGCVWHVPKGGSRGELKHSPLADPAKVASYEAPFELLKKAKFEEASRSAAGTSRFVLARSETQPLGRLRWLRGPQEALADLAHGGKEIRDLAAMLHDFFCRDMEAWTATEVDGVVIRDDWAATDGLLVGLDVWRDLFRPMYREYCRILRAGDKFVFFQSAGDVSSLVGDLIRLGVDAVHADLRATNLERLARRYLGKATFWGDAGLAPIVSRGSPAEVREAVQVLRRALDQGNGGVVAVCPWEADAPLRNMAAFFEQWMMPVPATARS
jgi:uroporphyrinogen decarboxylase